MSALLFADDHGPADAGRHFWGRCKPATALLLALATGFVLSASTSYRPPSFTVAASQHIEIEPPRATAASYAPAKPAATRGQHVAALSNVVARKYKISTAATREYVGLAFREAERHGLDPFLLVALMAVESSFNPIAESQAGAVGLMQVIPQYHTDKFDVESESVLHPPTNIRVGARVLKEYIRRTGGLVDGLQMYNGAAHDATTAFANKVLSEKDRLQSAIKSVGTRA
jgi:soluble lytic murein transglycosylase-like protein